MSLPARNSFKVSIVIVASMLSIIVAPKQFVHGADHVASSVQTSPINVTNCWVIVAQLNGDQAPVTTCRLTRTPGETVRPDAGAGIHPASQLGHALPSSIVRSRPFIGQVVCDNSSNSPQLQLWTDANSQGNELCLFGQGGDDLSRWSFSNVMTSWNNPGVSNAPSGKLYQGLGNTGDRFPFGPGGRSSNVGSGWNDKAVSVCISVYPCP